MSEEENNVYMVESQGFTYLLWLLWLHSQDGSRAVNTYLKALFKTKPSIKVNQS